ncbi:MAG: tetratricopeptide repeat protein [Alkalinema sp. RU_4_3]|nr:tetratricopeptide repeat protein [Alkalinema sp. RU_4_3]
MGKFALLIGVGKYQSSSGFADLAAAEPDVVAMRQVLVEPAVGGFAADDVVTLIDPEPQQMREALERLFVDRKPDDLVVMYFSGHGVVDDFGKFHLTSVCTDKKSLNSKAIPAGFMHGLMEASRSKRQVVILDCCFSGAFANGMSVKGEAVNLQAQLGGRGRAVLTSSSATEYSFEQKGAVLSVYTQYVVEGLRTGIADQDGDGMISVRELHDFAKAKVQEVAPAMQPEIYAAREGYEILIAQALGDPELEYRKEVEKLAEERKGEFSTPILTALEAKQQKWRLTSEVAASIRQEVLRPYEEFAAKMLKYQQTLDQELRPGYRLSPEAWKDLQYLQQTLGLTDENIRPLVELVKIKTLPVKVVPPRPSESQTNNGPTATFKQPPVAILERKPQSISSIKRFSIPKRLIAGGIALGMGIVGFVGLQNLQSQTDPSRSNQESTPSTVEDLLKRGEEKYSKKDYQGAIAEFDQAIKLKSDYADAYHHRGFARRTLGDRKGAIADYDQSDQLKPTMPDAVPSVEVLPAVI